MTGANIKQAVGGVMVSAPLLIPALAFGWRWIVLLLIVAALCVWVVVGISLLSDD